MNIKRITFIFLSISGFSFVMHAAPKPIPLSQPGSVAAHAATASVKSLELELKGSESAEAAKTISLKSTDSGILISHNWTSTLCRDSETVNLNDLKAFAVQFYIGYDVHGNYIYTIRPLLYDTATSRFWDDFGSVLQTRVLTDPYNKTWVIIKYFSHLVIFRDDNVAVCQNSLYCSLANLDFFTCGPLVLLHDTASGTCWSKKGVARCTPSIIIRKEDENLPAFLEIPKEPAPLPNFVSPIKIRNIYMRRDINPPEEITLVLEEDGIHFCYGNADYAETSQGKNFYSYLPYHEVHLADSMGIDLKELEVEKTTHGYLVKHTKEPWQWDLDLRNP